jgi:hypothetical protein
MKVAYNFNVKDKSKNVSYILHAVLDKKMVDLNCVDSPYFISVDFIGTTINKKNKKRK